jgi:hypothetical protein
MCCLSTWIQLENHMWCYRNQREEPSVANECKRRKPAKYRNKTTPAEGEVQSCGRPGIGAGTVLNHFQPDCAG